QLQGKLKENPRDADGWLLLARSLRTLDRLPEEAEAYMRALALTGGRADVASTYGEVLIEIADGTVTPDAIAMFRQALARDPAEPRARFYLGLAKAQAGDDKGAIDDWSALVRDSPADAPWLPSVRAQIADLSQSAGVAAPQVESRPAAGPVASAPPIPPGSATPGPRGPTAADMANAAQMSPEDRQQMIRGMVDGLAARLKDNPSDVDGWLRLSRAYGVLGEPEKARDALGQAAKQAPQRVDVLTQYAQTLFSPEKAADKPPQEFLAVMRQILAAEPTNAQALWWVGNDLAATGDKQQAAQLFKRLLERLPPNAPLRSQVQQQLQAVGG
ncbi:MAG: tetratricopeptide repeat protein, partial [Alphaproteobacteria bacterium]|nr:tetratricopeptide repeat protein [Alphaproteobacteria bacterium]